MHWCWSYQQFTPSNPITQLAINLDLQKQQKYKGHKKVNQK